MKATCHFIIFVLLGTLCLMINAFINGFPYVYSDTSTYIASGFELETPFDRPITYGLFLRLSSLSGLSLWLVIFFQAFILSYLIFLMISCVADEKAYLKYGLLTIIFLSLFTGLSWTVCQIMPDIFTAMALLCAILIVTGLFQRRTMILLYILYFISVAMHMSHIILFVMTLMAIFLLKKFIMPKQSNPKSISGITKLLLLTIASIVTMGSSLSKSKHVFFMGAMVEHGIVKSYLDEFCNSKPYKLCNYKDSLPDRAYQFIWDENSPFYKIGGWKGTQNEFNEIIYGTLTKPDYIWMHMRESFKATAQQLTLFGIGDGTWSYPEGTVLYERVSKYFSHDLTAYTQSKQNQSRLEFIMLLNDLYTLTIVLSLLYIMFVLVKVVRSLDKHILMMASSIFIGIILNAWDCGTFANAIDRLGCKMIWLIPFTAAIFFLKSGQMHKLDLIKGS